MGPQRPVQNLVDPSSNTGLIKTPPGISRPATIESLVERKLTFSDTGTLLIPHSEHETHCDDAVAIGPYTFAIADGVGSGGERSGDIARFMINQLEDVTQQPTNEIAAKLILKEILTKTAHEIKRVQRIENSIRSSQIDTVGAIGVLSREKDGRTYANLATVGNCRVYILSADGKIKLVTNDRTFVADHNRQYPQDQLDEKNHMFASTVTTTAAKTNEADYYRIALEEGDVLVAMSDGVTDPFSREDLEKYIRTMVADISKGNQSEYRIQDWVTALGNGAARRTPHDDISVIAARIG